MRRICKENMAAAALSFQSISHFPSCFVVNKQLNLRKPVLSLKEIADKSTPFCSPQLTVSSITSDGNRRGSRLRKTSASGRKKEDESENTPVGNKAPNSSNRKEIIALFRRIQSSISKGETRSTEAKSSSSSKDKSTAESVLDVLNESRKNERGSRSTKGGKAPRWKSGVPKKTQRVGKKADAATPDFKLQRPPSNFVKRSPITYPTAPRCQGIEQNNELQRPASNFVKRSPIPYPTAPRGKGIEQNNELVATDEGLKLANIEKLKLPELKELAKARGFKGYSRLKKSELVRLLSS